VVATTSTGSTRAACKHTAAMVTKMKFDPEAAFPKIFFSAERYLEANELASSRR
jgi:hypothetical protein